MNKKLLLLIGILACTQVQASEVDVVSGFSVKQDLPRLNTALRRINRRLYQIEDAFDINNNTSGILTEDRGGTGADTSGLLTGSIFIQSSTGEFEALSQGTSSFFLRSNGALVPPSFEEVPHPNAYELVDSQTFSAAQSSQISQAVASGEIFKFVWEGTNSSFDNDVPELTISNDATGGDYHSLGTGIKNGGTALSFEEASSNSLLLTDSGETGAGKNIQDNFKLEAVVTARDTETQIEYIWTTLGTGSGSPALGIVHGVGFYGAGVPSSIEFLSNGAANMTGRYYVYQYNN